MYDPSMYTLGVLAVQTPVIEGSTHSMEGPKVLRVWKLTYDP